MTTVSGLKTGDKLVVTAARKAGYLTEEEQKKADTITGFKLIAKSKQTKLRNGKKAIRITWNTSEYAFDGVEVWRSTKRNSGYGNKPRWIIKARNTKYYTPFSTKAYRKVR